MPERLRFCTRCGAIATEAPSVVRAESGPVRDAGLVELTLCRDCGERLLDFVRAGAPAGAGAR